MEQQLKQIKIRKLNALVNANKPEGTTVVLLGPEGFDTWVPSGWLVTTGNSNNGWGQTTNSNYGGGNDPYAFWNDDSWGSTSEDTTILISPVFSTVGYTAVTITFDYGYRSLNGTYSIEVSNDNGNTWQTVVADLPGTSTGASAQYPESAGNIVDISAAAGQNTNVMVRFAYRDAGGWEWYGALDNVVVEGGNPPPNCAVNIVPPDGASDVYIWTDLFWANGGGGPAGYKIWFGTDGAGITPPTNIENGTDLGNVLSYTPVSSLAGNTTYYWQIVPYNTNGDATGCPIWSFTTGNDPTVTTYPWTENFENFPPGQALANGWLNAGDDDFNWDADNNGTLTGGTGPNVDHTLGTSSGMYMYTESSAPNNPNKVAHLVTPPLDLSALTTPMLKFWYHMYGATMGELHIDVFSGGFWNLDVTAPIIGQQQTSGDDPWLESFVDLSGLRSSTGTVLIRFRGITGSSFTSDIAIDDVTVMEAPTVPQFSIDPDSVGYATVFVNDTSDTVLFTISNTGGGTLTINSVALTGNNASEFMLTDTNNYPVDLGIGQNITVEVAFTPTSEGAKTANLTISDNSAELIHNIPLTGIGFTGVSNVFPHRENLEHNGSLPVGWLQGVNGVEDDFDWTVNVGTTPSPSTGPIGDNTTGMGYYLFTEASIPNNPFKIAHLITPDIDLSGLTYPYISFWYHMFGFSMGELHVDVWDGTTWINDVMIPLVGQQQINQSDPYLEKNFISLIPYVGSTVKVRFRAVTGNDFASDMAIDDILISDAPPGPPGVPFNPQPANGEGGLSQYNTILSWDLGFFTTSIDLYFGN
ncbi:MAG: choice-of-anchor D domain-containing protein, partial [Calditrichia bacterium]